MLCKTARFTRHLESEDKFAVAIVQFNTAIRDSADDAGLKSNTKFMKKLLTITVAASAVFALAACEEDERHSHDHQHPAYSSTTTTEETTVHQAAPTTSTTVRTY